LENEIKEKDNEIKKFKKDKKKENSPTRIKSPEIE